MALDKLNLDKLNEFSLNGEKEIKPIIKISELKLGHPYKILRGCLVKTKFGDSIIKSFCVLYFFEINFCFHNVVKY